MSVPIYKYSLFNKYENCVGEFQQCLNALLWEVFESMDLVEIGDEADKA
jgi:hypothetical protein